MALRLWEEVLATFQGLPENRLQFAMMDDEHLVIVPRDADRGGSIYQIDHCTLPVVLEDQWDGEDHDLVGEVYMGRQEDRAWLTASEALSLISEPKSSSVMRLNVASSATDRAHGVVYKIDSDRNSEADSDGGSGSIDGMNRDGDNKGDARL